jgi:Cu2+-exporting ATPase
MPVSIEETSSCQDSCCDGDIDAEPQATKDPGEEEPTQEKPGDCCSSGKCAGDKAKDDSDAPDCCRGKPGPCCDTSCLNRLAMRECEMSIADPSGEISQAKSK